LSAGGGHMLRRPLRSYRQRAVNQHCLRDLTVPI